jgi:hypothetical protein
MALLRRRSAMRRIGVSYEAVEVSPSVLPFLMQLGLAVRLPSAPTLERAVSEPIGVPLEMRSIGGVEHTGA